MGKIPEKSANGLLITAGCARPGAFLGYWRPSGPLCLLVRAARALGTQSVRVWILLLRPSLPASSLRCAASVLAAAAGAGAEGEHLLKQVKNGSALVLLDVAGKNLASEELARFMADLSVQGQSDITFVIGGAFGVSPALQKAAHLRLSFSRMTFTHQMVRLLLVEQIYRAFKINRGEPYHW